MDFGNLNSIRSIKVFQKNGVTEKLHLPIKLSFLFPGDATVGGEGQGRFGWHQREIKVNPEWKNKRTFLTIGASDWETTVWLDGNLLGKHQGGYTPFSFELTPYLNYGERQKLVVRADDKRRDFTLYGKQGYGNARGLWQTVYLEARGKDISMRFTLIRISISQCNGHGIPTEEAGSDLKVHLRSKLRDRRLLMR